GRGGVAQQWPLDDAVFLRDRAARLVGGDRPAHRQAREIDVDLARAHGVVVLDLDARHRRRLRILGGSDLDIGVGRYGRLLGSAFTGRLLELVESLYRFFDKAHRRTP